MPQRKSSIGNRPHKENRSIPHGSDTHQDNYSRGCRTPARASARATADSAEGGTAARAGCRRKVCGAAPQHARLPKLRWEPAGLHVDAPHPGGPGQRAAARYTQPPSGQIYLRKLAESHQLVSKRFLQPESDCSYCETSSVGRFLSKASAQIEPRRSPPLIASQVTAIQSGPIG